MVQWRISHASERSPTFPSFRRISSSTSGRSSRVECSVQTPVLLIAGVLGDRLPEFVSFCRICDIEPLVELHSPSEIPLVITSGATLIGINNRDLRTMEINLNTTRLVSEKMGRKGLTLISMSGICWPFDIRSLRRYCDAFLVGSSIMASASPKKVLEGFVFA